MIKFFIIFLLITLLFLISACANGRKKLSPMEHMQNLKRLQGENKCEEITNTAWHCTQYCPVEFNQTGVTKDRMVICQEKSISERH